MLLTSMWKGMQLGVDGEEGELGGSTGPLQDVAMQALASQAVRSRGIGIAQMIVHSMEGRVSAGQGDSTSQKVTLTAGQKFALSSNAADAQVAKPAAPQE
jgi:Rod binding domain-containing protein